MSIGTAILVGVGLFALAGTRKKKPAGNGSGGGGSTDMLSVCEADMTAMWAEPSAASAGLPLKPSVGEQWEVATRAMLDSFVSMIDQGIEPGTGPAAAWKQYSDEHLREIFPHCDMPALIDMYPQGDIAERWNPKAQQVAAALDLIGTMVLMEYLERYPALANHFDLPPPPNGGGGGGGPTPGNGMPGGEGSWQPEWTTPDLPQMPLPPVSPGNGGGGGGGGITPSQPPRPNEEYEFAEGRYRTYEWSVATRLQGGVITGWAWAVPGLNAQGERTSKDAAIRSAKGAIDAYLAQPAGYGGVPGATAPVGTSCAPGSWFNAEHGTCWPNKYKCPEGYYYNFDHETCRPVGM